MSAIEIEKLITYIWIQMILPLIWVFHLHMTTLISAHSSDVHMYEKPW